MTSAQPVTINEHGVPMYPRGHVGRLLVCLAAIDKLERPTATTVAKLTGLSKGKVDDYVNALAVELAVNISRNGPVYHIEDWGPYLKASAVRTCLKVPVSENLRRVVESSTKFAPITS